MGKLPIKSERRSQWPCFFGPERKYDMLTVEGITIGSVIQVYDLQGRQVLKTINTQNVQSYKLDTSALGKGIYMAKVGIESPTLVKFVKE